MGMSLALEFMVEWLRDKYDLQSNACGIQPESHPAFDAGRTYISVDDDGVEGGREDTDSLKETLSVTVGIWIRSEHLMKDRQGAVLKPSERYIEGARTLYDLEKMVKVHQSSSGSGLLTVNNRHGFHGNYAFMSALNSRYALPDPEKGADFKSPLRYRGRGRLEPLALQDGQKVQAWLGFRLRFRGLYREQKFRTENDAIG